MKGTERKVDNANGTDNSRVYECTLIAPPSLLTLMRSVFAPGKTYRFRLSRVAELVTSGSGTMSLGTAVYPSQFVQYSALSALFTECRLRSTNIHYTPRIAPGVTTVAQVTVATAFDPTSSSGTPTYTAVIRYPSAKTFALIGTKYPVRNSFNKTRGRPFSTASSSGSGFDPVGGVNGVWLHAISATTSASATILDYVILADYEFRNVF